MVQVFHVIKSMIYLRDRDKWNTRAWPRHGAAKQRFIFYLIHLERSKHSVNNVAEQAEVDEDDDTEDNCSFGVESVLIACRLIVVYRFWSAKPLSRLVYYWDHCSFMLSLICNAETNR